MAQKETQVMKKNIRLIIIICIAALLLGGAVLALTLTAPEKEEEEAAEEEIKTSLLYDKAPEDLAKITIENDKDSYEVVRVGEGDDAKWTVMELVNLPLSGSVMTKLVDGASSLTAQQTVVDNPADISIYGLDKPSATVTAEFSDSAKTVKKLIIGNLTPEETKRYLMIEGDTKVYTVYNTVLSCFLEDKYALVSRTVYSARAAADENDTTDYTKINKLTISRPDIDYDIVIEYDTRLDDEDTMVANSSNYVMTEPVFRDLNPEKSSDITDSIFGLSAKDLAVVNPEENDFEVLGINAPAAEVTAEINGGDTVHLRIGDEYIDEDGKKAGRYVHAEGINIIYIFDEGSLPWLSVSPLDVVTTMYTSNYVYDLEGLKITADGRTLDFEISGAGADDFAVKLNGADADGDRFKTLYQFILRAPSSELYFEETEAEPSVTVEILTKSGEDDIIEFIPLGNRQAAVRLNGETVYKCAQAYVDRLAANSELYEKGEEIVENW